MGIFIRGRRRTRQKWRLREELGESFPFWCQNEQSSIVCTRSSPNYDFFSPLKKLCKKIGSNGAIKQFPACFLLRILIYLVRQQDYFTAHETLQRDYESYSSQAGVTKAGGYFCHSWPLARVKKRATFTLAPVFLHLCDFFFTVRLHAPMEQVAQERQLDR